MTPGTRLGPYEILDKLGAGGMGEVYLAQDTRLGRRVAIKVLPAALSADPERRARFLQEARLVSELNHPHVCTLHDVGQEAGTDFLVMEHLQGETLEQRLHRGPLPLAEALEFGAQMAEALAAAHARGIVHRDLKPANVMLTRAGAKLLDFGIAKLADGGSALEANTVMATVGRPMTAEGSLVGTLQYMAPEQLEAKPVDARADLFAMGAILYEMVSGQRAFAGDSAASIIAAILTAAPRPLQQMQALTPPSLDWLVGACLRKSPEDRWRSAHDLALQLRRTAETAEVLAASPAAVRPGGLPAWAWLAGAALLAGGLALGRFVLPPAGGAESLLLLLGLDMAGQTMQPLVSPDGTTIAIEDGSVIRIRRLDGAEATTFDVGSVFSGLGWSADSRWLVYASGGAVMKKRLDGGPAERIAAGKSIRTAWGPDGTLVFAPFYGQPLMAVSADGGEPRPLTELDAVLQEDTHLSPVFLPDGRRFLYLARSTPRRANTVWMQSLDGGPRTRIVDADTLIGYADEHLFFTRQGIILAQPFDEAAGVLSGSAVPVAGPVEARDEDTEAWASVGAGVLAYQPRYVQMRQLAWMDRGGRLLRRVGAPAPYDDIVGQSVPGRLSADERWLLTTWRDPETRSLDVWKLDLERDTRVRLTSDPNSDYGATWLPGGREIAFASDRTAVYDLYTASADGGGGDKRLLASAVDKVPSDISPDGNWLVLQQQHQNRATLVRLPLRPPGEPAELWPGPFDLTMARIAPDGQWVAHASDESGASEVYLRRLDAGGDLRQVSVGGGNLPKWRADMGELFYRGADGIYAVALRFGADGALLDHETPRLLFQHDSGFESSADGQRFLVLLRDRASTPPPVRVIVNWRELLRRQQQ